MTAYEISLEELRAEPRRWLVTGCAGFIGSHLVETLLRCDQRVNGLDDFSTGSPRNLDDVRASVSAEQWARFEFREGSVADMGACRETTTYCDFVLHEAGFISVPLSIEDPVGCHNTNVSGTLNLLIAARDNRVRRFVFASSSAVYGDDAAAAKVEAQIGRPLSPYGASKLMDEIYARQFFDHYGLETVGLRYFNVFGTRQNPSGGYAAVIPQWITKCVRGEECVINGDGGITRDFCPVANIVQANVLAATARNRAAAGEAFNVALGGCTTLADLYELISSRVAAVTGRPAKSVRYGAPRPGDIIHSSADIARIQTVLGFEPAMDVPAGLDETVAWYARSA
ncbi:MAG: NAD-dependent epimerase/dehydratase family protein [Chthoniobacteraceae bacterium]